MDAGIAQCHKLLYVGCYTENHRTAKIGWWALTGVWALAREYMPIIPFCHGLCYNLYAWANSVFQALILLPLLHVWNEASQKTWWKHCSQALSRLRTLRLLVAPLLHSDCYSLRVLGLLNSSDSACNYCIGPLPVGIDNGSCEISPTSLRIINQFSNAEEVYYTATSFKNCKTC